VSDTSSRRVILSIFSRQELYDKIAAIKGVRALTGMGLKEAKEAVEDIVPGRQKVFQISHAILEPSFTEAINRIRSSGLTVQVGKNNNVARSGIGEGIRKLVTYANMSAQYDISRALLDVLETYCPEPSQKYLEALEALDDEDIDL